MLYNVRKYQDELDLPAKKLLQEVTTRWGELQHFCQNHGLTNCTLL